MLAGEADGLHDVGDAGGPDDDGRMAVDHAVPDAARLVVFLVIDGENRAAQSLPQRGQVAFGEGFDVLVHGKERTTAGPLAEMSFG